ncbi:MAG: hypothetical protein JWN41_457 [Thermoleophilia bacterium]|nr:hypothetical protein [Thermoleophilia bacterium]
MSQCDGLSLPSEESRYRMRMDPRNELTNTTFSERLEPLDDWLHLQPSLDEDRKGRIYLPVNVENSQLRRGIVLAAGDGVEGIAQGDVVLTLATKTIDLRDGTQLARRDYVVARIT